MITRIFLDLDDVLNTLTPYLLNRIGCECPPDSYDKHPTEAGWDIVKAANILHPTYFFNNYTFWSSIKRDFWANVPKSIDCDWIVDSCASAVGKTNVCILSCPTLDPDSLAGKLEWIHLNMPTWLWRQYLIGPRKRFCARQDALLIDDRDENVGDFVASGGSGIIMPRPWNKAKWCKTPRKYVNACLDYAFREIEFA